MIASHPWHLALDSHHGRRRYALRCLLLKPARTRISANRHLDSSPRLSGHKLRVLCRTQHIHQTRSVTHDQLRHTSLVMISRRSFQVSESRKCGGHAWRTLLASVGAGDESVTTFTNEDLQHEPFHTDSSHRIPRRILSPLLEQPDKHHNLQGFHISLSPSMSSPESRITVATVRTDTIEARSARSACVHTAIVNHFLH